MPGYVATMLRSVLVRAEGLGAIKQCPEKSVVSLHRQAVESEAQGIDRLVGLPLSLLGVGSFDGRSDWMRSHAATQRQACLLLA